MGLVFKMLCNRKGIKPVPQGLLFADLGPNMAVGKHRMGVGVKRQDFESFAIGKADEAPVGIVRHGLVSAVGEKGRA